MGLSSLSPIKSVFFLVGYALFLDLSLASWSLGQEEETVLSPEFGAQVLLKKKLKIPGFMAMTHKKKILDPKNWTTVLTDHCSYGFY
jgi:hypothetical protein